LLPGRIDCVIILKYKWALALCGIYSGEMMMMTKGQLESKISEAVSRFEMEQMGRGPEKIRTIIFQDLILIRLKGFLSTSEKSLAQTKEGIELVKKVRTALFENARDGLENAIKSVLDASIISTYSDVSTKTGEKIIVVVMDRNIEDNIIG